MRAKGKNYKRMNKKQKEKVDKTLKRMTKTREKDNTKLRKNIKAKLEWAQSQKQRGIKAIEESRKCIETNSRELLKLEGICLVLTQLLQESFEETLNNKKTGKN